MITISHSPNLKDAISKRKPIVAIESTFVTHGFDPKEGLALAQEMISRIEEQNVTPAFVGIIKGRAIVGLSPTQLEEIAMDRTTVKVNVSNLAAILSTGKSASTTVSATLFLAHQAGIGLMITGGIGGVHRGAETTSDISSDLTALSRFPVAVVCSGAKAILDLRKTVEYLETQGVPVFGFQTDQFSAFYRRESGLRVDARFDSLQELSKAIGIHLGSGMRTGVVVTNPIPVESEMSEKIYEGAMSELSRMKSSAKGREVTPEMLRKLEQITHGESRRANRALLIHNAEIAAKLAREMAAKGPEEGLCAW